MSRVLADRLKQLQDSIAAACARVGRPEKSVQLIVVTKTAPPEDIKEVIRLGCTELGENRVQRLRQVAETSTLFLPRMPKILDIPKEVHWHMIGHLQPQQGQGALKYSRLIHSVDTLRLAEEINSAVSSR